jgi:multiple sugar transport system permease protein
MVMWRWVYNAEYGLLNTALRRLYAAWNWAAAQAAGAGLDLGPIDMNLVPGWIESVHWALPSLIFMSVWGAGSAMMIFLAGLQNIPEHLYEAASIDGAGRWRKFVHITLPQLSPTIFFNLVMGIIGSFQVFAQAYLLPSNPGGPANATLVYVLHLYQKAFGENEMGYACALGWILFAVILGVTLGLVLSSRRWVYYEGGAA